MSGYERMPLEPGEIPLPEDAGPTGEARLALLNFNLGYQIRCLRWFARIKLEWERMYPGREFPGLCAEIDSVTGAWRPISEQRAWSWGDGRALGIWSYMLIKGRIPGGSDLLELRGGETVETDLRLFYEDYVDLLYRVLIERLERCGGKLPHIVDINTNKSSSDPVNLSVGPGEYTASHIFGAAGFLQYGLLRDDGHALDIGLRMLEESLRAAHEFRFVDHVTGQRSYAHSHGLTMVCAGAVVDTCKALEALERLGRNDHAGLMADFINSARWAADMSCRYHWNGVARRFSEYLDPVTKTPYIDNRGRIICDPGHAAEGVGFFAELVRYLPEKDDTGFMSGKRDLVPVLADVLSFVDEHGYSPAGVMYKAIDLRTGAGIADIVRNGREYRTAPWWNVRETCAAAARLYQLTGTERMWEIYRRAFRAAYLHYANLNIGGLMVQALDAETLRPLPFMPATGNLDPMHSARAREREIEALENR